MQVEWSSNHYMTWMTDGSGSTCTWGFLTLPLVRIPCVIFQS